MHHECKNLRCPVTLNTLRQESADKADYKAGEIPVMVRLREVPTTYDDMYFSKWQSQADVFKAKTDRHNAHWISLGDEPDIRKKNGQNRETINLLEARRLARKTSLDRKSYQFDNSESDMDIYGDLNWED